MSHILTVNTTDLNKAVAEELKKQKLVNPPEWSQFVKTGANKERLPDNQDWWYNRSAAILRGVVKLGPVGTEKLRTKYAEKKIVGINQTASLKHPVLLLERFCNNLKNQN